MQIEINSCFSNRLIYQLLAGIIFVSILCGGIESRLGFAGDRDVINVTLVVTVPNNTPESDSIYVAGSFNNWDPGATIMNRLSDTTWQRIFSASSGTEIEYKYTRGDWDTVEKDSVGAEIANRTLVIDSTDLFVNDVVLAWADVPVLIDPENIQPILTYYSNTPQMEVAITWASEAPGDCQIRYGINQISENQQTVIEHYDLSIEGDSLIHVARLTGLSAGTTYKYQVETTGVFSSDTLSFTTAEYDTSFQFIVAGDNQLDLVPALLDSIITRDPAFMLHVGDLVVDGTRLNEWYTFLGRFTGLNSNYVMLPVYGNHDQDASIQRNLFQLPDNGAIDPDNRGHWFAMDYNNVHIIGLDVQRDYESGSEQYAWLVDDLTNVPANIDHIIVYFHQPAYNSSGYHGPNLRVRQTFEPLFIQYGVDLVFSGHNHHYERSLANGITYITTGGMSCWLKDFTLGTNPWSVYAEKVNHYCQVFVDGKDLTVKMIRLNGTIGDVYKTFCNDGSDDDWLASGVNPLLDTDNLQTDQELQLERLFIAWDDMNFYFGFDTPARNKAVTYSLYFDVDNIPGSGGTSDYAGNAIATDSNHLPEVELYLHHLADDSWDLNDPQFLSWDSLSSSWQNANEGTGGLPSGGVFTVDSTNRFAELTIPHSAPGFCGTDSFYVELFTVGEVTGAGASESIPSDSSIQFTIENTSTITTVLSNFHGFNITEPVEVDTHSFQIDGNSVDWHVRHITPLAFDTDQCQLGTEYHMDSLFVHLDSVNLYIGFWSPAEYIGLHYGIYIDTDNIYGSGGTIDKWRCNVTAVSQHLPDVTIYAYHIDTGGISSSSPKYYTWNGSDWSSHTGGQGSLPTGGQFGYSASNDFFEIMVPRSSPGLQGIDEFYITLFNFGGEKYVCETVPSDPMVQYYGENTSNSVQLTSFAYYEMDQVSIAFNKNNILPNSYRLNQNYPNPFNPFTNITYELPEIGLVVLSLYDIRGRQMAELVNTWQAAGYYNISFNSNQLASGVYFYRLQAGDYHCSRKMILLK